MNTYKTLVIIPARGGSKGVPRKNLRPLYGKPLLFYVIKSALKAKNVNQVIVSTDDEEIALFAERFGAGILMRPSALAGDEVTLDSVIKHTVETLETETAGNQFDIILTIQPTSPLIKASDIDNAIKLFDAPEIDTVISAVDDRHLRWQEINGVYLPAYEKRLNRQQLPATYKETGAIIGCRRNILTKGTRIGKNVALYMTEPERSIDIDSSTDFYLCESLLRKKRIVFAVIGRKEIGLGHAYRAIMLAHELVAHELIFVCEEHDELGRDYIAKQNYSVITCANGQLINTIAKLKPDLVINDILDTDANYVATLKKTNALVVNFEDMGLGAETADLVFNALYPHQIPSEHIFVGPQYFCLRDEFLHAPVKAPTEIVKRILLTFGGVDEGNLTSRILQVMGQFLTEKSIAIDVVLGPGYEHQTTLQKVQETLGYELINVVAATTKISEYMLRADLAITSGGRTVLELAALDIPTVVLCQNERETTHKFASAENGIINLGIHQNVSDKTLLSTIKKVINDRNLRATMITKMKQMDLTQGKKRVIKAITSLLENEEPQK